MDEEQGNLMYRHSIPENSYEINRFNDRLISVKFLVHSCKYQELKVMCHLSDIHNNTILKHISKRGEVQGTTFNNPRALPAHAES